MSTPEQNDHILVSREFLELVLAKLLADDAKIFEEFGYSWRSFYETENDEPAIKGLRELLGKPEANQ